MTDRAKERVASVIKRTLLSYGWQEKPWGGLDARNIHLGPAGLDQLADRILEALRRGGEEREGGEVLVPISSAYHPAVIDAGDYYAVAIVVAGCEFWHQAPSREVAKQVVETIRASRTPSTETDAPDWTTWEKCHSCGRRYGDVYWADDEQWEQVMGGTFGGLLCPRCFIEQAEALGLEPEIEILAPPLSETDAPGEGEEWIRKMAAEEDKYGPITAGAPDPDEGSGEGEVGAWGHPYEVEAPDGSGVQVWSCCGVQVDEGHATDCRFRSRPEPTVEGETYFIRDEDWAAFKDRRPVTLFGFSGTVYRPVIIHEPTREEGEDG